MTHRFVATAVCALITLPTVVFAQQVTETDQSVEMLLGNDIYTAGANIDITRDIAGDINAAGAQVMIKGNVGGDVQAAGSNITVSGNVEDDVRVAGGSVTINGQVRGDVIAFGGTIYIAKGSSITGNVFAGGGDVTVEGDIRGNLSVEAENATVNARVGGLTRINAEKATLNGTMEQDATVAANQLTFGNTMSLRGDLQYWNANGQLDTSGKVMGTAQFDPQIARKSHEKRSAGMLAGILTFATLYALLATSMVLIVLMLMTRTFFTESARRLQKKPWMSLLYGVLYFVATPGIILLLAITVIGIPLALVLLSIYLITVFLAKACAALVIARWFELKSKRVWHPVAVFAVALSVYAALKLLMFVPILGWVVCFLLVVTAYGALSMVKMERYRKVM